MWFESNQVSESVLALPLNVGYALMYLQAGRALRAQQQARYIRVRKGMIPEFRRLHEFCYQHGVSEMNRPSLLMKLNAPQSLCLSATAALALCCLVTPGAAAQSTSSATQDSSYQGVSHPPADDTIEATPDAAPVPPHSKPLPGVPLASSAPAVSSTASNLPGSSMTARSSSESSDNTDDGIVTSVPSSQPERMAAAAPEREAHLIPRAPENPDYGIVGMVPSPSNQLAEGTNIRVRLMQTLSTRTAQDGEPFHGQVAADVYKEGRVVIPVGSELRGRVISVTQGHRLGTPATLRLRPDAVLLPDGTSYHLYAQAIRTDAPGTRADAEGGIQPSSRVARNLAELGAGSGGGAATGAILAGPVGAATGAIVGAGLVTAHLLLQHPHQASVEQGSEITFSLAEPMDLLPTRN